MRFDGTHPQLVSGAYYTVVKVNEFELKLTNAGVPTTSRSFDPGQSVFNVDADPDFDRYVVDGNTFWIPGHGFANGQQVTYDAPDPRYFLRRECRHPP